MGTAAGGERLHLQPAPLQDRSRDVSSAVTPADAARIAVQQNRGGRVLSVQREMDGYRVKLEKNGEVRIVYVPGS